MSTLTSRGNKIFTLYVIVSLIILVLLLPRLSNDQGSHNSINSHLSLWANEYVLTYNNHNYTITDQLTADIGQVIGAVTYHGSISGDFKLFSINQIDDYSKIAVQTKIGYLIAIMEE
jgi:hypothetical protein